jgi:hypothetical protein
VAKLVKRSSLSKKRAACITDINESFQDRKSASLAEQRSGCVNAFLFRNLEDAETVAQIGKAVSEQQFPAVRKEWRTLR